MNPVLIYTSTAKIAADKSALNLNLELFQNVYNAFKAINISPTLQEIGDLLSLTVNNNSAPGFETDYAVNKLLDAAAPYNLNGVQLQRSKVKDMIVPPNMTNVKAALIAAKQMQPGILGNDISLLTLANDVISKVNNSDTIIETRNTFYTQTDAGATMANSVQAVCDALNTFDAANGKVIFGGLSKKSAEFVYQNGKNVADPFESAIAGVEMRGGQFGISLPFIRSVEHNS
ncbi:hypothetical protein [Mucilaginibacter sp.]|uniref:hypothetical protein n=1 Tax=Mucilaginibacter sp. TaxID=1882438 RepID=UPI0025ECB11E|nr:hypothetical protein [Mucilaginibacter sp.]